MTPIAPTSTIRTLDEDLEIRGFRIPKGVSSLSGVAVVKMLTSFTFVSTHLPTEVCQRSDQKERHKESCKKKKHPPDTADI